MPISLLFPFQISIFPLLKKLFTPLIRTCCQYPSLTLTIDVHICHLTPCMSLITRKLSFCFLLVFFFSFSSLLSIPLVTASASCRHLYVCHLVFLMLVVFRLTRFSFSGCYPTISTLTILCSRSTYLVLTSYLDNETQLDFGSRCIIL